MSLRAFLTQKRRRHREFICPDWVRDPERALDLPLIQLGKDAQISWRSALSGSVILLGQAGSGKSSVMDLLLLSAMRQNASVVCFTVKTTDVHRFLALAQCAARQNDIEVYNPFRTPYNPLQDVIDCCGRSDPGLHGKLLDLVMLPTRHQRDPGSGGDSKMWLSLTSDFVSNLLTIGLAARVNLTFAWLSECIKTLPRSPEEAADPAWQARCPACVAAAKALELDLNPAERYELDQSLSWLLYEVPAFSDRQVSSVQITWAANITRLVRGRLGGVLNDPSASWTPSRALTEPRVLILDCSEDEFGPDALLVQKLIKARLVDEAAKRDTEKHAHVLVFAEDEFHRLIEPHVEQRVRAQLRSKSCMTIAATQTVGNVAEACSQVRDPRTMANNILGLSGVHVFCRTIDPETQSYAERTMQTTPHMKGSFGTNDKSDGKDNKSTNFTREMRPETPGYLLSRLNSGGERDGNIVEAYVCCEGRLFPNGRSSMKVEFPQLPRHLTQPFAPEFYFNPPIQPAQQGDNR